MNYPDLPDGKVMASYFIDDVLVSKRLSFPQSLRYSVPVFHPVRLYAIQDCTGEVFANFGSAKNADLQSLNVTVILYETKQL